MMQTLKYLIVAMPFVAMLVVIVALAYESIRDTIDWLRKGGHW